MWTAAPLAPSRQRLHWSVFKVSDPADTLMSKSWHLAVTRLCILKSIYQRITGSLFEVHSLMETNVVSAVIMTLKTPLTHSVRLRTQPNRALLKI